MDMKEGRETAVIGKQRLEAFSDGVLAVAVTLLVLDLHADPASPDSLAAQLRQEWPSFVAYLVSFFIRRGDLDQPPRPLFALVARVDRLLMFYNLLLLLFVTTIPFTTSTLAGYLLVGGPDSRLAVVMYGASMEGMAISFTLILWHLIRRGLLLRPVSPAAGRKAVRRFGLGSVLYPLIMIVGLLSPAAMLILYSALTTFYIAEQTPILPDTPDQSPLREQ